MSYYADETYKVYREVVRKARKLHRCGACGCDITPGTYYCAVTWVVDQRANGVKRCGACQKTHEHLRALCRQRDHDMWPDEWLNCGLNYAEEWDGDPPEHIQALPLLSAEERGQLLRPKEKSHDHGSS